MFGWPSEYQYQTRESAFRVTAPTPHGNDLTLVVTGRQHIGVVPVVRNMNRTVGVGVVQASASVRRAFAAAWLSTASILIGLLLFLIIGWSYPDTVVRSSIEAEHQALDNRRNALVSQLDVSRREVATQRVETARIGRTAANREAIETNQNVLAAMMQQVAALEEQIRGIETEIAVRRVAISQFSFFKDAAIPIVFCMLAFGFGGIAGCAGAAWRSADISKAAAIAAPLAVATAFLAPRGFMRFFGIEQQAAVTAEMDRLLVLVAIASLTGLMAARLMRVPAETPQSPSDPDRHVST